MNTCYRMLLSAAAATVLMLAVAHRVSAGEDVENTLTVSGVERSYWLHLPPTLAADKPLPLVIDLHGGGGNAQSAIQQTGFDALADHSPFIVAYPNGSGRLGKNMLTWNAGSCCGLAAHTAVDDSAFIRSLVAKLESQYPIDPKRIYASGMSNGAMMSYRLACEASDLFAAIAVVSGTLSLSSCAPTHAVSVLHIHGNADQHVPLAGGVGPQALDKSPKQAVLPGIDFWVKADGCAAKPQQALLYDGKVTQQTWSGCKDGSTVVFDLIDGGGHAWPGGKQMRGWLDTPSTTMNATPVIWQFFAAHPKP